MLALVTPYRGSPTNTSIKHKVRPNLSIFKTPSMRQLSNNLNIYCKDECAWQATNLSGTFCIFIYTYICIYVHIYICVYVY
jgi:hypothetical protein